MNKLFLLPIMSLVLLGLSAQTYAKDVSVEFYEKNESTGALTVQDTDTVRQLKLQYGEKNNWYPNKIALYVLKNRDQIQSVTDVEKLKEMRDTETLGHYHSQSEGPLMVRAVCLPGCYVRPHKSG